MLEEAEMLTQSGNFDQVTGIKEIARELKTHLKHFTSRLDELKDKIENTAKCYHLLDKVNSLYLKVKLVQKSCPICNRYSFITKADRKFCLSLYFVVKHMRFANRIFFLSGLTCLTE